MLEAAQPHRRGVPAWRPRSSTSFKRRGLTRHERLRSENVDPWEDNELAITTDGRKLATDARTGRPRHLGFELSAFMDDVAGVRTNTRPAADLWRRMGPTSAQLRLSRLIVAYLVLFGPRSSEQR